MVEHDVQHALTLVGQLDGVHTGLGTGGGKDIAHHGDIHHALAYKAGDGGLMAGAALGDDGDTVSPLQGIVDDHIFLAPVDDVPVGGSQTVQQLVGEVFGIVDEFLHFHRKVLLIMI